ncbi:MAG: hypothetical protein IJE83_00900 [Oscillospiraceae bacterium]|nr:hypothetical protein [Oscillospiraceae bacterium]
MDFSPEAKKTEEGETGNPEGSLPLKGKYILATQGRPYNLSVKHTGNLQNNFPVFFRQGAKFSHYFIKIRLL